MAYIKKFQEGGAVAPVAAPTSAPANVQQDPIQMLVQMAMQALQSQDCQMAMQVCDGFVAFVQQAMSAGSAPVDQAPEGEPVFKKGGKMIKRKKCSK